MRRSGRGTEKKNDALERLKEQRKTGKKNKYDLQRKGGKILQGLLFL